MPEGPNSELSMKITPEKLLRSRGFEVDHVLDDVVEVYELSRDLVVDSCWGKSIKNF